MRILVADDDPDMLDFYRVTLAADGDELTCATDGEAAWKLLERGQIPLALLNWRMPGVDGLELTRRLRARATGYTYVVMVTARAGRDDLLEAMAAGVDDFVTKPVDIELLRARLRVAKRVLALQQAVSALGGLLTICAWCSKVRDEAGDWQKVDQYISKRTSTQFSHGLCRDCFHEQRDAWRADPSAGSSG